MNAGEHFRDVLKTAPVLALVLALRAATLLLALGAVAPLLALGAAATPLFAQTPANPALLSVYRGDPHHVLARAPFGELSEADLYLFLLMTGKEKPDLFARYRETAPGPARNALRKRLEAAIRDWALAMVLAEQVPDDAIENLLDRMRLRLLLHPVHEMIWMDRLAAPQALVAYEDLRKYYAENAKAFPTPPTARVRCIFLRVDADSAATSEALRQKWDDARTRMNAIQDSILLKALTFDEAARKHSEADNAQEGGLTPEFEKGTFFAEFEKRAFGLPVGNFRVFDGPDGVYLLQGERTTPPGQLPFEKVVPEIQRRLFLSQLARLYEQEAAGLRSLGLAVNRARIFSLLSPRTPIVKVGPFRLNRDMVLDLFPNLFADTFETGGTPILRALQRTETSELIAQDNERRGWDADARMLPAVRLARIILKSDKRARQMIRPLLILSRPQVRAYLETFPDLFPDLWRAGGSFVQVRLLDAAEMGEANRRRKMDLIRETVVEIRDWFSSTTLEEVAASWPMKEADPLTLIPTLIERELIRRVADASVSVLRWDTSQSTATLREEAKPLGRELARILTTPASAAPSAPASATASATPSASPSSPPSALPRFLPLVETEDTIGLLYVEQPAPNLPAQAGLSHFKLSRVVAAAIEKWALEALQAQVLAEKGPLEILFP